MSEEFNARPLKMMRRLHSISLEQAEEYARQQFIKQLGHQAIDIPIATDAAGNEQIVRFKLRDLLKRAEQQEGA